MSTIFYLVRHGQTKLNVEKRVQGRIDSPLTQEGVRMAKALYPSLSNLSFRACVSSPSQRAVLTAMYMFGRPIDGLYEGLQEIDFGTREGWLIREAFKEDPEHTKGYQRWGGESKAEAVQRFLLCLEEIADTYGQGNILVSSHGTIIREVLYALDASLRSRFDRHTLVPNCSVTQIAYDRVFTIKALPSLQYLHTSISKE